MPNLKYKDEITKNDGRVFVVGDLHGEITKLYKAMDHVNFNYDEDLIISVGDLVDRGPNSLDCFNLIYKSWFKTIRGNHEQFCYDRIYTDIAYRNSHNSNGGLWFDNLPYDIQEKIATESANLPIVLTLNRNNKRYGFVHGDINMRINSWDELLELLDGPDKDLYAQQCLWGRTRIKQSMSFPNSLSVVQLPSAIINGVNQIYLGHTVIKTPRVIGNMNFIDTGACFTDQGYGILTLLEID